MQSDTSMPRLVPKRMLDTATGVANTDYYWDGLLAPKIEINGHLVDQFSGYSLIKKDLDNALKWMQRAKSIAATHPSWGQDTAYNHATDRESFDTVKAYFIASLTFYGKCFTEAAGRRAQVSRDWLDAEYRELHDYYMKYRHNLAAHSGDEQLELAKTYVLLHPSKKDILPYLPTMRYQPDIALSSDGEPAFPELIEHVAAKVVERFNKVSEKIYDVVLSHNTVFWVAAADKGESITINPLHKR
jgi:hypothetical protein